MIISIILASGATISISALFNSMNKGHYNVIRYARLAIDFLAQGIGYNVGFAQMILNENIITFNQLDPSSLSHVQLFLDKKIF